MAAMMVVFILMVALLALLAFSGAKAQAQRQYFYKTRSWGAWDKLSPEDRFAAIFEELRKMVTPTRASAVQEVAAKPRSPREVYWARIREREREEEAPLWKALGSAVLFIGLLMGLWVWEVSFAYIFPTLLLGIVVVSFFLTRLAETEEKAEDWRKWGWSIHCSCGRHIPRDTVWKCGYCADTVNDPVNSNADIRPHLYHKCGKCGIPPTAIICPECSVPIQLGPEPVFRPATIYVPPDPKTAKMLEMERKHKEYIVQLELEAERDKHIRKYQAEVLRHELEMLFERVGSAKEAQRAALNRIADLKESYHMTPQEEKKLMEFINDKVMEAIHVDRESGRTRPDFY